MVARIETLDDLREKKQQITQIQKQIREKLAGTTTQRAELRECMARHRHRTKEYRSKFKMLGATNKVLFRGKVEGILAFADQLQGVTNELIAHMHAYIDILNQLRKIETDIVNQMVTEDFDFTGQNIEIIDDGFDLDD